jgi:hypothetical protein
MARTGRGANRMMFHFRNAIQCVALTVSLAVLLTGSSLAEGPRAGEQRQRLMVEAQPITQFDNRDAGRLQFGALRFRGGLVLSSSNTNFGGISALRMAANGADFIAVTDRGRWFKGRIVYDGARPVGIADAELAPILGADGKPLAARGWFDSEAIAVDGGTVYVGYERVNRIVAFNVGKDGLAARGRVVNVPDDFRKLPRNRGIEALVVVPAGLPLAGTLIALSERAFDGAGNIRGFLIGGKTPGVFAIPRKDDFDITDAAILPSGALLVLERFFSPFRGLGVRIRRIPLAAIKPGAVADGTVIFQADLGQQIDNFEALGLHRTAGGEIVLTLVSDDNFNMIQRTLLLQFTLAAP